MTTRIVSRMVLLAGLVLALAGSGCSRRSREARYLRSADNYFTAKKFDYAAIQYLNVLRIDPTNSYAIYRLGSIYQGRGEIDRAFYLLQKANQLSPNDVEIEQSLGTVLLAAGDRQRAREHAIHVLSLAPENERAALLLSDCALSKAEFETTHERLAKLLRTAKRPGPIYLAQGDLYLREGRLPEADAALSKASALEPKSSGVHAVLAYLDWLRGDVAAADREFQAAVTLSPEDRSPNALKWAEFRLRTGNLSGAKEVLEGLTRELPDFLPAWADLGDIALDQRDFARCADIIKRMRALNAKDYRARMLEASLAFRQNQTAKAVEELEQLRKDFPTSVRVLFDLSRAHLANHDLAQASIRVKEALSLNHNFSEGIRLSAEISLRQGDASTATGALEALNRRQPNESSTQLLLAEAYRAQGRQTEAVEVYRSLATRFPTNALPPFLMGVVYRQQAKPELARAAFRKALELAPSSFDAMTQLVGIDIQEKKYQDAQAFLESMMKRFPKAAPLRVLSADVYITGGKDKEAEKELEEAIQLDAGLPASYLLLSQIYVRAGNYPVALEKLRQILAKQPGNITALVEQGVLLEQTKDYAGAAKSYERILAVNGDFVPALNNLAYLYCDRLNEPEKALKLAQRARQLRPTDPAVGDTMGWALYRRQEYAWASGLLQESAALLPMSVQPDAQYHLGMNYYMLGQIEEAHRAFQRVLQLNPKFENRDKILDCLSMLELDPQKATQTSIQALQKRLEQHPDDLVGHIRIAQVYLRAGSKDRAVKAYEQALTLNPKAPAVLINLAQLYSEDAAKAKTALEYAQTARNLMPNDPTIAASAGRVAYKAGNFQWSLSLFQEATTRRPADGEICFDLAKAYYAAGKLAEARSKANQALGSANFTQPTEARQFLTLVSVAETGRAPDAQSEQAVQTALRASPNDLPELMAQGVIQEQTKRFTEAASSYERLLERDAMFVPAMKRLARLYDGPLNDKAKAFDWVTRIVKLTPEDVEAGKMLAFALYRRGEFRRCVALLQPIASRPNPDPESLYYLGMAHYRLKESAASKKALQSALALNLEPKLATEVQQVLRTLQ